MPPDEIDVGNEKWRFKEWFAAILQNTDIISTIRPDILPGRVGGVVLLTFSGQDDLPPLMTRLIAGEDRWACLLAKATMRGAISLRKREPLNTP